MVRDKVRIRFRKAGDLRLVSHHDLMRCWERMLRRAAIPFHSTAGFNPKPRLIFALSLGLGIVGSQEVVELELDAELPLADLAERLRQQAPAGLEILSLTRIDPRAGAQVRRVGYRIAVPSMPSDLDERIARLLASDEVLSERAHPQRRRINIRPYIDQLQTNPDGLDMILWVTPNGTARPDEILVLLGLEHLLPEGAVLERYLVELHDEVQENTISQQPQNSHPRPAAPSQATPPPSGVGKFPMPGTDKRPEPLLPGPLDF